MLVVEVADELEVGEVGIFTIDGDGYAKKRGEDALVSLNPADGPIRLTEGALQWPDDRCAEAGVDRREVTEGGPIGIEATR